ncbi:MAG: amidohydrolase family protein [Verrucomicrobiia bacterium]
MELLVDAGMTPLEVITAATKNGAEFFGIEDRLGTIEAGKMADLILIEGEPDKDIGNMRNVRSVILNGRLVYEKN